MRNKKGISLIVLVITIIVMVILAVSVIVSLVNNNVIGNAKEAKFKNDVATIKESMNLEELNALREKRVPNYKGILKVPYDNILKIAEEVLYYIGENLDEEEWAKDLNVFRGENIPEDWINIAETTPENGISLLIEKPADARQSVAFKITTDSGKYTVDWGDGSSNTYASDLEASHKYNSNDKGKLSTDGYLFQVNITPDSGNITQYRTAATVHSQNTSILWCQVGCNTLTSCEKMLSNNINLKKFGIASKYTLSSVTDMYYMFARCSSLTEITLLETSSVTNMERMFERCSNLTKIPKFDTSNVTNMSYMFSECRSLTKITLINTSSATNMSYMFYESSSLTTIPKLDTSNVTSMGYMFYNCRSLKAIPELNTSNVATMNYIFAGCSSLETIPELNTSKVTNIARMFSGCNKLTTIPQLNTSSATSMGYMFSYCSSLTKIPELNTSSATNMNNMFHECSSLKTIPEFDTSNVTSMNYMFYNCSSLETIPLLNTSKVTNMRDMFSKCNKLSSISIANTGLDATKINNVFSELPTITSGTIDITGNPGASGCDRTIATSNGWTVKSE